MKKNKLEWLGSILIELLKIEYKKWMKHNQL